ncbi:MAG: hypothetical protein U0411_05050 [Thermodesulfovibrionales bacterium]
MGKCDCGAVTDWVEIGSTWVCKECGTKEVEKSMEELKHTVKKLKTIGQDLQALKVDTLALTELIDTIQAEIGKIRI